MRSITHIIQDAKKKWKESKKDRDYEIYLKVEFEKNIQNDPERLFSYKVKCTKMLTWKEAEIIVFFTTVLLGMNMSDQIIKNQLFFIMLIFELGLYILEKRFSKCAFVLDEIDIAPSSIEKKKMDVQACYNDKEIREKSMVLNKEKTISPKKYWENKLSISVEIEVLRYNRLCGSIIKKDETRIGDVFFVTYRDWKEYILSKIARLNLIELHEFYHFLNLKGMISTNSYKNLANVAIPIVVSCYIPIVFANIPKTIYEGNEILAYFGITICLIFCVIFFIKNTTMIINNKEMEKSFYTDMKEIVKEQIDIISKGIEETDL